MVNYYLLRPGSGEHRLHSKGSFPLELLLGHRLWKASETLHELQLGGESISANAVGEPYSVVLKIDSISEAKRVGAVPERYYVVIDFKPSELGRALVPCVESQGTDAYHNALTL